MIKSDAADTYICPNVFDRVIIVKIYTITLRKKPCCKFCGEENSLISIGAGIEKVEEEISVTGAHEAMPENHMK